MYYKYTTYCIGADSIIELRPLQSLYNTSTIQHISFVCVISENYCQTMHSHTLLQWSNIATLRDLPTGIRLCIPLSNFPKMFQHCPMQAIRLEEKKRSKESVEAKQVASRLDEMRRYVYIHLMYHTQILHWVNSTLL